MKALLTGGAGFIGSHLAEGLLQLDWEVRGIDSFTDYYPRKSKENNLKNLKENKNFFFIEGDLLGLDLKKVYGPRQRPDMAFHKFIKALLNDEEITIYGDGNQTRDFTYVSDVVEATIEAAQSKVTGEIINIGGGAQVTVNETLRILEEITKKKAKVKYSEKQKGDMLHTFADISKAKKLLNYQPRIRLKEGLRKELAWLKG